MSTSAVPEYVYTKIPYEYRALYHRLLAAIADFGKAKLEDCSAQCIKENQKVLECYDMFEAMVAAKAASKSSLANAIKTYIEATLDTLYKGLDPDIDDSFAPDDEGYVIVDTTARTITFDDVTYRLVASGDSLVDNVVYSDVNITTFTYPSLSASGGSNISPTVSFTQTETTTYINDATATAIITSGETKAFTKDSSIITSINATTGAISYPANTGFARTLGTVNLSLTSHSKTKTSEVTLEQPGQAVVAWHKVKSTYYDATTILTDPARLISFAESAISESFDELAYGSAVDTPVSVNNFVSGEEYIVYALLNASENYTGIKYLNANDEYDDLDSTVSNQIGSTLYHDSGNLSVTVGNTTCKVIAFLSKSTITDTLKLKLL